MEFSERLRKAREERGITQERLAQEFHTSRQNISSWENGKTYPNMQDLIHLSDFFDISLDVFLKEDGQVQESLEAAPVKKLLSRIFFELNMILVLLLATDVAQTFIKFSFQPTIWFIAFFLIAAVANEIEKFYEKLGFKVVYPWQRFLNREENREN